MNLSENPEPILAAEATLHYEIVEEAARLTRVENQIELVRTRELLARCLPKAPAVVLDVGGAAGIHAFHLASQGYQVHLSDAVPHHIEQAREQERQQPDNPLTSIEVGDAHKLPHDDGSADAVLLFGPLYHLIEREDRVKSLREAHRTLRVGGVMMAVGISRFISTINCLSAGMIEDSNFQSIVEGDLQNGQHRNPTTDHDPAFFTTTFFHHPDELRDEVEEAGFELKHLLAVEGPARILRDFADHWPDPKKQEWLLDIVRKVESEEHLLGVSTHMMAVAIK